MNESPIIVALDFPRTEEITGCAKRLDPEKCRVKIGFEAFLAAGPALVEHLQKEGFDVFLDLKFHDIPNTVAAACRVAASLGVWMINVHASGGQRMMEAAAESLAGSENAPLLIAVTVLTSMSADDLYQTGLRIEPAEQVSRLADLAQQSGMNGVVCSAREASALRASRGKDFLLVTPGIRPAGSDKGDQHRVMTPADAIGAGSDYLVIGRPVSQSSDPGNALNKILITLS